jgi:hypothetical protein
MTPKSLIGCELDHYTKIGQYFVLRRKNKINLLRCEIKTNNVALTL